MELIACRLDRESLSNLKLVSRSILDASVIMRISASKIEQKMAGFNKFFTKDRAVYNEVFDHSGITLPDLIHTILSSKDPLNYGMFVYLHGSENLIGIIKYTSRRGTLFDLGLLMRYGNLLVVKYLINQRGFILPRDKMGYAAIGGIKMIEYVVKKFNYDIKKIPLHVIQNLIENNSLETIKYLAKNHYEFNEWALYYAIKKHRKDISEYLMSIGIKIENINYLEELGKNYLR